jgi:hypothetical protein
MEGSRGSAAGFALNEPCAMTTPVGLSGESLEQVHEATERLRRLSLDERGKMIEAACRDAALIQASRLRQGLPIGAPAPWPPSTIEFLREHAPHGRA